MSSLTDFTPVLDNASDRGLTAQIKQLAARQRALEATLADQQRALDAAVKAGFAAGRAAGVGSAGSAWRFDARMPNTVSDRLSLPERDETGRWVRWLVSASLLPITVRLLPDRQYDLTVVVPKFASEVAYQSLYVRANGQDLPWLTWEGATRTTIVSHGPEEALSLILAVADPGESDAPFAISLIDLKAR
ncbi:hypothetical protein [Methylobacterium organophilum]|uniref:Uncharacterized protein n=1 Tax=Methylobacterium organophilum TaxID=410 RepID=A0ABQ4TEX7_METOR|nr:hypothetical protein [Methylobacterium organophilum]GJE28582.1 hypothetical protein LKMONMHP_3454 [Methylobacterium organophilum]